jgi:hypothetical protein
MPAYAARVKKQTSGQEWTQEQKDEYNQQWNVNFRKKMAKVQEGQSRDLNVELVEITDVQKLKRTYQNVTTEYDGRIIWVQATDKGIDMLRFRVNTADNPFYFKTMLNNVLRACGVFPKEEEGLDIEFEDLIGTRLIMTIMKQGERGDGKYGGFYTKIVGFKPHFDDEDEDNEPPVAVQKRAGLKAAQTPVEEAKAPWEDEDEED